MTMRDERVIFSFGEEFLAGAKLVTELRDDGGV
jgi:hypothetical protein